MSDRGVFLDRDGTLNRDLGFTYRAADLELLPGVTEGLRRISAAGYRLFITTNQSGIGRGRFSEAEMHAFNAALVAQLKRAGVVIEAVYYCPYYPSASIERYRLDSPLRKPRPGMILAAVDEHGLDLAASFTIGDKPTDIEAGRAAGCRTILVRTGAAATSDEGLAARPDFVASDMIEAATLIQRAGRSGSPPVDG